jgi:phosphatidylglycerophosphate synthase
MTRIREQLPLVRSLEDTLELWPKMTQAQKFGAAIASIVTLSGPILRALLENQQGLTSDIDAKQRILATIIDSRDKLDGTIAKSTGGVTPFGKELDPLMDKVDFALQEVWQARRGQLAVGHVATRLARDVAVTLVRSHVSAATNGEVDVAAGWHGKTSTFLRIASLRATGLASDPRLEKLHQTAATTAVVLSGAKNIHDLMKAKQEWQQHDFRRTR